MRIYNDRQYIVTMELIYFLTVSCSNTKGGAVNRSLLCTIIIDLLHKCLVADNHNSIFNVYHQRVITAQDWEVIDCTI